MAEEKKKEDPPPLGPYWAGVPVDGIRQLELWQENLRTHHSKQLYQDGHWVTNAVDDELHITVCNQVKTPQLPQEIKEWIRSVPPEDRQIKSSAHWYGELEVFHKEWKNCKDRPDASYDIIVWKPTIQEGSFLYQLHEKLHAFWNTKPQFKFNPHVTIGYVGSGHGDAIVAKWNGFSRRWEDFQCDVEMVVVKKYKGDTTEHFFINPPVDDRAGCKSCTAPICPSCRQFKPEPTSACDCESSRVVWEEDPRPSSRDPEESATKKLKTQLEDDAWR
jgi:hypothetical protein